jgi:hypothetical protein
MSTTSSGRAEGQSELTASALRAKLLRLRGPKNEEKEESTDQGNNDTCEEQDIQNRGDVIRNRAPLQRGPHPTPITVVTAVKTDRQDHSKQLPGMSENEKDKQRLNEQEK